MRLDDDPPWSKKQLRRLGEAIRERREQEMVAPSYDDVVLWYDDLQATIQECIGKIDFSPILGDEWKPLISGRPKTIDTLREKLVANPNWPLSNIIDVAGVRVEGSMTLSEQDAVARLIADSLGLNLEDVASDTRQAPHSGYRALHLRANFPAGKAEIQIRTSVQSAWANMYEDLADLIGRGIRYGEVPDHPVGRAVIELFHLFSVGFAVAEYNWDMAETGSSPYKIEAVIPEEFKDRLLNVIDQTAGWFNQVNDPRADEVAEEWKEARASLQELPRIRMLDRMDRLKVEASMSELMLSVRQMVRDDVQRRANGGEADVRVPGDLSTPLE
ncbi:hypothetical protein [Nocardia sp. NPDC004260]